jgi:XTP/dITP diphosphohydrolase
MKILLGTRNKGKFMDIHGALADLPIIIVPPDAVNIMEDPVEHGATFEENALLKARFYHGASGLPTIADDSGLIVEALQGEMGVYTRRWGAGPNVSDHEWIAYFLNRMKSEANKRALFVSTVAFINHDGTEHVFRGECRGTIADALESAFPEGLPLQGCFKPEGSHSVFGNLSAEERNAVNHRHQAVMRLKDYLSGYLTNV